MLRWPSLECSARIVAKDAAKPTRHTAVTAAATTKAADKAVTESKGSEDGLHFGGHGMELAMQIVKLAMQTTCRTRPWLSSLERIVPLITFYNLLCGSARAMPIYLAERLTSHLSILVGGTPALYGPRDAALRVILERILALRRSTPHPSYCAAQAAPLKASLRGSEAYGVLYTAPATWASP